MNPDQEPQTSQPGLEPAARAETTTSRHGNRRRLRWIIYILLMVTSAGAIVGRILAVSDPSGTTPFLSANDRSRWATIRALVDHGQYKIDQIIREVNPESGGRPWHTIDRVRHKGWDGLEHDYSSKPPLLATLLAGQYWLIKQLTGATITEQTFFVGRLMLILTNVLPLVLFWCLLARLVERLGNTDWGRCFVMFTAVWGTYLSTFAITLNNHSLAAISGFLAVFFALPIWAEGRDDVKRYFACGLFAAFAATNDLPALSLLALLGAALLLHSPAKTLAAFAPAVILVAAMFFGTTWNAHGSLRPPYAHRSDRAAITVVDPKLAEDLDEGRVPRELVDAMRDLGIDLSPATTVNRPSDAARWVVWDRVGQDRLAIVLEDDRLVVREWGNWYEYPGSYWTEARKRGVDRGEPSRLVYAFHLILGHHGVFSLTPVWLLSIVGTVVWWRRGDLTLRGLAAATVLLTLVCMAFYISRPLEDRNYGGVTSGFRWTFWLIPLWLLCLLPAADTIASRRWWRRAAYVLLLISVISVTYPAINPWQNPWLYDVWMNLGW